VALPRCSPIEDIVIFDAVCSYACVLQHFVRRDPAVFAPRQFYSQTSCWRDLKSVLAHQAHRSSSSKKNSRSQSMGRSSLALGCAATTTCNVCEMAAVPSGRKEQLLRLRQHVHFLVKTHRPSCTPSVLLLQLSLSLIHDGDLCVLDVRVDLHL
jgi:hypothetical protein